MHPKFLFYHKGVGTVMDMPDAISIDEASAQASQGLASFCCVDPMDIRCVTLHEDQCHAGVHYEWGLVNENGAWFDLIKLPHNSAEDVTACKRHLKLERDVLRIDVLRIDSIIELTTQRSAHATTDVENSAAPSVTNGLTWLLFWQEGRAALESAAPDPEWFQGTYEGPMKSQEEARQELYRRGYEETETGSMEFRKFRYKIVKIFRKSGRRITLQRNLSWGDAKKICEAFPDSTTSMVSFYRQ